MMATFTCERYPQLSLRRKGVRVQFQNGTLEASGSMADAVREVADRYGITEVKPAVEPKPEPRQRQTRAKRDEPAGSD